MLLAVECASATLIFHADCITYKITHNYLSTPGDFMPSALLRIYLKQNATFHDESIYEKVIEFLLDSGINGATLLRGIEGYGADKKIHTIKVLQLSHDIPVVMEVIDDEEKLRSLIPQLREIVGNELMTIQKVEIV